MKNLIAWVLFMLPTLLLNAQPPCASNPAAGNSCATATPICDLNGYCGSTAATYTANTWSNSCGLFGLSDCGLTGEFCGSIENNSFLSFTASATSISFDVWVTSSTMGYGIQIFIFSVNTCGTGPVTQYGPCYNPGVVQPGPVNITATGLTIGNTYYIMIDGNAGDVCNYVIGANSGIATPVVVAPATTNICPGESVNLTASGGDGTYTWDASPDLNTTTGANVTATPPSTPGTYTYTVNSNIGTSNCPNSGSFDATVIVDNCGCTITAGNSGNLCTAAGLTVDLTCSGISGATYSWTGPGGFTSTAQNPTSVPVPSTPGTYDFIVEANDNGTTCQATTTVTVYALPNVDAGSPMTLTCSTTSVVLGGSSATGGATFSWSGPGIVSGGSTATPTVNAIGNYTLTVTDPATTCVNSDVVAVDENVTLPNINAGNDAALDCITTSVALGGSSATMGATFSWSGPGIVSGGSTATPTVNAAGTYTLTVTDPANGCTDTDVADVTQNITPPDVSAGSDMELTCTATSLVLGGSSSTTGATFSWSGPGIVSGGSTATPTVNATGAYTLTVTDPANGCTDTDVVDVTQNITTPNVSAGSDMIITCSSPSVVLGGSSSTSGATFSWAGPGIVSGGSTATPTVNQAGTYTLTVTDPANGCTDTDNVDVTTDAVLPSVSFSADTLIGCETLDVTFTGVADPGLQYAWNFGDGATDNGSLSVAHNYSTIGCFNVTLTVTDPGNGCSNSDQINNYICIIPTPTAAFNVTPDNGCGPLQITMNNTSQDATVYDWTITPGITQQTLNLNPVTLTITESVDIELIASNDLGCSSATTAYVMVNNCGCMNPIAVNYDPTAEYDDGSCVFPPASVNIPNVFTPNNDGNNDYFELNPMMVANIDLLIMNRWGNVVFEESGVDPKWDGKIESNLASEGTYFYKYVATGVGGEEISGHGFLQLIRD